jgi:hypothetical protein
MNFVFRKRKERKKQNASVEKRKKKKLFSGLTKRENQNYPRKS